MKSNKKTNKLVNNSWVKEEVSRKITKYFKLMKNENAS